MKQTSESVACSNCGAPMIGRSCKLRCTHCGYFEDCSDTGLPAYSSSVDQRNDSEEGLSGQRRSLEND